MRGAGRLMALVITVAALGCTPASERDLIGTWQITHDAREYLPEEYRGAAGALTLIADGTFTALELPVWVPQSPPNPWPAASKPALLSGSGSWKLGRSGNQTIVLSIRTATDDYPGNLPYGYSLFIHWGLRDYSLVDYWGDPDAVPGIFFSKAETAAGDSR